MSRLATWLTRSVLFFVATLAFAAATAAPAQIGVFRDGEWFLDANGNGVWDGTPADIYYAFGQAGDMPVVGDWTGDGITKIGIFRNGLWWLDMNGNGVWDEGIDRVTAFGMVGDMPIVGDWTGDGISKIGVFRSGDWFLDANDDGVWAYCAGCGSGDKTAGFWAGSSSEVPIAGDWYPGGAAVTRLGTFDRGVWLIDSNGDGNAAFETTFAFGLAGDIPVTGDWNGDGFTKAGVFRNGTWSLDYNGNFEWQGAVVDRSIAFGLSGDKPVTAKRWK